MLMHFLGDSIIPASHWIDSRESASFDDFCVFLLHYIQLGTTAGNNLLTPSLQAALKYRVSETYPDQPHFSRIIFIFYLIIS